jgi:hypothetical protein
MGFWVPYEYMGIGAHLNHGIDQIKHCNFWYVHCKYVG